MNEQIIIQLSDFTTGCKWLYPEIRELLIEDDGFEELVLDDSTICVLKCELVASISSLRMSRWLLA